VSERDPRIGDYLASERTFLAWVRTSISVIVFGFVVAKFGITLRQLLHLEGQAGSQSNVSLGIGTVFMLMGTLLAVVSLVRYQLTLKRLEAGEFRPARGIILFVGVTTAVFGAVLVTYLLLTAPSL
jgi:inner membrane protein YidH